MFRQAILLQRKNLFYVDGDSTLHNGFKTTGRRRSRLSLPLEDLKGTHASSHTQSRSASQLRSCSSTGAGYAAVLESWL